MTIQDIRAMPLAWKRPPLYGPTRVTLKANDYNALNAHTVLNLKTDRDYILYLPKVKKVGGMSIVGGRNVHLVGGYISPNPEHNTSNSYWRNSAIRITGNHGIVHIEGVLVDSSIEGQGDGIHISNNPNGIVQIENCRLDRILAGPGDDWHVGVHGDAIQLYASTRDPRAAVKELRVDKLTASSSASCLQLQGWGPTKIRRANLSFWPGHGIRTHAKLIRVTEPGSCKSSSHRLSYVYADASLYPPIHERISPEGGNGKWCDAMQEFDGAWGWPSLSVYGRVIPGLPPGGDFVPKDTVGLNYSKDQSVFAGRSTPC